MVKLVCYIIDCDTYYRPFAASVHESEGDNDSNLFVVGSGKRTTSLEEAQEFVKENSGGCERAFLNPVKRNQTGITWLSELEKANQRKFLLKGQKHFFDTMATRKLANEVLEKLKTTEPEHGKIIVYYSQEAMCIFDVIEDTSELRHIEFISTAS